MNILLVSLDNSRKALIGGKHIHQELLKQGWREAGHRVDMVYPSGPAWWLRRIGRKVAQILGFLREDAYFREAVNADKKLIERLVRQKLERATFDVVSAQDVVAAVAAKRALDSRNSSVPIVLTLHGYFARESVNYGRFSGLAQSRVMDYCTAIEREAFGSVAGVATVDSRIRDYVHDAFGMQKPVRVIPNAIDDRRFFPVDPDAKRRLRQRLGIDLDATILIVARRLVDKNGVRYAVEAMDRLVRKGISGQRFYLLTIGKGPEEGRIREIIGRHGLESVVKIVGMVPHRKIDEYYKAADIVLMPSIRSNDIEEATSLSMLEGLACGKIVIASAIGGLKEVISSGVNGLLVPDKDPEALASVIHAAMHNDIDTDRMRENASAYARQHAGYREHARKFVDWYDDILRAES